MTGVYYKMNQIKNDAFWNPYNTLYDSAIRNLVYLRVKEIVTRQADFIQVNNMVRELMHD